MDSTSPQRLLFSKLSKRISSTTISAAQQALPSPQPKNLKLKKAISQAQHLINPSSDHQISDKPTSFSALVSLIKHCAETKSLDNGRSLHAHIKKQKYGGNTYLGNWIVKMYGDCGSMDDARAAFDSLTKPNCHSWNILIKAYNLNGQGKEALKIFNSMQTLNVSPTQVTFLCVLEACVQEGAVEKGRELHSAIVKGGYGGDALVGTALINMYGRCGSFAEAVSVFRQVRKLDLVSWNAMISACNYTGNCTQALDFYDQMRFQGFKPNRVTFIAALNACASLAAIKKGREIHSAIVDTGCESEEFVVTALMDMYGKCVSLLEAEKVFFRLPQKNLVAWNAMISAYANNGLGKEALHCFGRMQSNGLKPDQFTFLSVLAACRHTGQVDDAKQYFTSMSQDHGLKPNEYHYLCLIDILGRAGRLEDAESLIGHMPSRDLVRAWLSLLAACRIHGDLERGARAAQHVLELDPDNAPTFVSLADIYAEDGNVDFGRKFGGKFKFNNLIKMPG